MSLNKIVRTAALVSVAVAVLASPAFARVKSARGNVSAVDWNAMQIAIKGVDGKINTFLVRRDTGVKFTDTPEAFPSPGLKDVVPPMYVWFDFEDYEGQQPGLIQKIDVHDMPVMVAVDASGSSVHTTGPAEWQNICARMEAEFGKGNFETGVLKGIEAVTQHLAKHFPKHGAGRNELPDAPVVM